MYINKRKSDKMTNKEILEKGKLVQHYPLDHDPFTGQTEIEHGFENLVIYDQKVYSVLTDFTGSVADPNGEPALITDDADTFMEQLFVFEDPQEVLEAETEAQDEIDYDAWERWESAHGIQEDWTRDDEW